MQSWDLTGIDVQPRQPEVLTSAEEGRAIAIQLPAGEALDVVSPPEACNAPLIRRLKRKSRDEADEARGVDRRGRGLHAEPPDGAATEPVVSMELRTPLGEVSLFTIIATLGAPLEVTAANLAIETFLPADADSAARLRELAEQADHTAAPTA
jgi:hypothetical protein